MCFDYRLYKHYIAISYTNKKIVEISDFIISGVVAGYGGAAAACNYAKKRNKTIINVL